MVRKREETLEEGLNRSANKRGLTGAERHRYIGGTLQHLGKAKPRHKGDEKHPRAARASTPRRAAAPRPAARRVEHVSVRRSVQKKGYVAPALRKVETKPAKKAYVSPALTKRERLDLTVKENKAESAKRTYKVYSIYRGKELYKGGGLYRSMAAGKREAKIEMDAANHPRGIHTRERLA